MIYANDIKRSALKLILFNKSLMFTSAQFIIYKLLEEINTKQK